MCKTTHVWVCSIHNNTGEICSWFGIRSADAMFSAEAEIYDARGITKLISANANSLINPSPLFSCHLKGLIKLLTVWIFIVFLVSGLKFDLSSSTDSQEASALGYKNDYIMIYSNSWGPSDFGFIVDGPDSYTTTSFKNAVALVRFNYFDS